MRKHMRPIALALALILCLGLLTACTASSSHEESQAPVEETEEPVVETEEPVEETEEPVEETDEETEEPAEETDEAAGDGLLIAEVTAVNEDGGCSLLLYDLAEGAQEPADYADIDLTLYEPGTETAEYTPEDTVLIYAVTDGTLSSVGPGVIVEGDMLAFYTDEDGTECIAVYHQAEE